MRGVAIRAGIGAGVLLIGFIIAVAWLNATVYTPGAFVRTYLDALGRKDAVAALELAGPAPSSSANLDLLAEAVMVDFEVEAVTELPDEGLPDGSRRVHVDYTVDGRAGSVEFDMIPSARLLGLFPTWGFTTSPLATVDLTVLHTREFTANGVRLVTPATDAAADYLAFTPGMITFGHESTHLQADEQTVLLGSPGRAQQVILSAEANADFVALVQSQADAYLDECATQQVLYPDGCPFGRSVGDFPLQATIQWSMVEYPVVTMRPTTTLGEWAVAGDAGLAHVELDVRAYADGSVHRIALDVPFRVGYVVTFVGPEIIITPRNE